MDHLEWLVRSRSENQRSTVALYLAIRSHKELISTNVDLQDVAEELAAIAFSLWRAVFLSDLVKDEAERLSHLDMFLESLIADNTIVYATDKRSREWTFRYYMSNAQARLAEIARQLMPELVDVSALRRPVTSKKERWEVTQETLNEAIARFESILRKRA